MAFSDLIARIKGDTVTTGIDVGHHAIKMARVEHTKSGRNLLSLDREYLPAGTLVDNEVKDAKTFREALARIVGRNFPHGPSGDIVVGISWSAGILADRMQLKKVDVHDQEAYIIGEASKRSPFDEPGVILDYEVLGDSEHGDLDVLIVAAKEAALDGWTRLFLEEGIRPVALDIDAFALVNLFLLSARSEELESTVAIFSMGDKKAHISFVRRGRYLSTREVQNGAIADFLAGICRQLGMNQGDVVAILRGERTEGYARDLFQQSVDRAAEECATALELALRYYTSSENQDRVQHLIITGGGASIPGLVEFLGHKLEIKVRSLNPFSQEADHLHPFVFDQEALFAGGMTDNDINTLTVALGLAMRKF